MSKKPRESLRSGVLWFEDVINIDCALCELDDICTTVHRHQFTSVQHMPEFIPTGASSEPYGIR